MDAASWDARYRDKELLWTAEPNQFLVAAVADLESGTALDLAAGEGRNSVWLAAQGWRVDAVDFSPVALEKAKALAERSGVTVQFALRDLTVWEPPPYSYDLAVVTYLHLPRPQRTDVWRGAAFALTERGRLVLIGHDSANLAGGYGGPQDASVLYTAEEARDVLEGLLYVEQAEQMVRLVEDDDGTHEAIDNVVVATRR